MNTLKQLGEDVYVPIFSLFFTKIIIQQTRHASFGAGKHLSGDLGF